MANKVYLVSRPSTKGLVTLYAEYSHARKVKRIPTHMRVPYAQWDNTSRTIIGTGANALNKKAQAVLDTVKSQIQELYLANGCVYPTCTQLTKHLEKRFKQLQIEEAEPPLTEVLTEWITTKEDWAASTRRNFNTLLNNIRDFERANRVTWHLSSLQTEDVRGWQKWLKTATQGKEQQGYNDATLHKRVRLLRQFLRKHPAPGVNLDDEGAKALHAVMLTTPFVLSQTDLDAIEQLALPPLSRLDKIRDLLILQAFCGLRWSDLRRLENRFIVGDFISIPMKKSAARAVKVHVPLFRQARNVLAKYTQKGELRLPIISEQKFNEGIKEVCQQIASLHEQHTQDYRLRGIAKERTKLKWEFVTSHTLRRTFVSQCLDSGFSQKEVMSWSGHLTLAAFQRYVGATAQRPDSIKEFDQRWEAARHTEAQAIPADAPALTIESLLSGIVNLPLTEELKQVLSQYAAGMRPQQTSGTSSTRA